MSMRTEKKIVLDLPDYFMTISLRPKNPPTPHNNNLKYNFWADELKEWYDRYEDK
jgi:hypothetical protein